MHKAFIVVDLSNGDSGKGTIVDTLTRTHRAHTVVRFNGGAQAGHRVVTEDGHEHIFSQFGSGTFVPGTQTFLSEHVLVSPWSLIEEERILQSVGVTDGFTRHFIHEDALVITPFHRAANRLREIDRAEGRHGSCGMGIGETAHDALTLDASLVMRMRDWRLPREQVVEKLAQIQVHKAREMQTQMNKLRHAGVATEEILDLQDPRVPEDVYGVIAEHLAQFNIVGDAWVTQLLAKPGVLVFEGAQGVLIDEWRGFHPYTTWSTCTFDNAEALLEKHVYAGSVHRIGVVRAYATRHGPGPFVTMSEELMERIEEPRNKMHPWQREFRIGSFDAVAIRYALEVCGGVDALAITCLDVMPEEIPWMICDAYQLAEADRDTDLCDVYNDREPKTTRIRPGNWQDLEYQERLAEVLLRAKPKNLTTAATGSKMGRGWMHARAIEHVLDTPAWILSFGPTVKGKQFRSHIPPPKNTPRRALTRRFISADEVMDEWR